MLCAHVWSATGIVRAHWVGCLCDERSGRGGGISASKQKRQVQMCTTETSAKTGGESACIALLQPGLMGQLRHVQAWLPCGRLRQVEGCPAGCERRCARDSSAAATGSRRAVDHAFSAIAPPEYSLCTCSAGCPAVARLPRCSWQPHNGTPGTPGTPHTLNAHPSLAALAFLGQAAQVALQVVLLDQAVQADLPGLALVVQPDEGGPHKVGHNLVPGPGHVELCGETGQRGGKGWRVICRRQLAAVRSVVCLLEGMSS